MFAVKITEHFDSLEFACKDGVLYPDDWIADRLTPLCQTLEVIRTAAGGSPIHILSGYRTLEYNRQLGGAASRPGDGWAGDNSQHPQGRAADFTHPTLSAEVVHKMILKLYAAGQLPDLGGLGLYVVKQFIHADVRPRGADNHLAQWWA